MQNKRSIMFAGILTPSSISVVFEPFTNFMALPRHMKLEFSASTFNICREVLLNTHGWFGLLCLKAYSLITIDMQQTCWACFGCFVKTPTCWKKSVWWIEIHKKCFETEKSWVSLKSSKKWVNWSIGIQQTFGLSDKTSLSQNLVFFSLCCLYCKS